MVFDRVDHTIGSWLDPGGVFVGMPDDRWGRLSRDGPLVDGGLERFAVVHRNRSTNQGDTRRPGTIQSSSQFRS